MLQRLHHRLQERSGHSPPGDSRAAPHHRGRSWPQAALEGFDRQPVLLLGVGAVLGAGGRNGTGRRVGGGGPRDRRIVKSG